MNFKAISLHAAVATAVVASSVLAISPSHAATIGSRLDFTGLGQIDFVTPKVDFTPDPAGDTTRGAFSVLSSSTGSFTGLSIGTIKDIGVSELTSLLFLGSGINNFLTAGLETFNLTEVTSFSLSDSTVSFAGFFGDGVRGLGSFTVDVPGSSIFSYKGSLTAVAVPTPALLPGLLALGAGVLRKRKAAAIAEAEADA